MDTLWNCVTSVIPTTKGFEPGAAEKSVFPSFGSMEFSIPKLPSLDAIKTKSSELSFASLRNVMLQSFNEFNNGYFFIIVQLALLVYCPTVALSIMYEPLDQQFIIDKSDDEQLLEQTQTQMQFIQQISRFIQQMLQSIAQQNSNDYQQTMQEQQYIMDMSIDMMQQQQSSTSTLMQQLRQLQQLQRLVRTIQEAKATQNNNESGGVKVRILIKVGQDSQEQRQGRHTVTVGQNGQVWQTVFITF